MNQRIPENQKFLILTWLNNEGNRDELFVPKSSRNLYDEVRDTLVLEKLYDSYVRENFNNDGQVESSISFLRYFREKLQKKGKGELSFSYDESLKVISSIFNDYFSEKRYFEKELLLINDYPFDPLNARAEWRAYFEYRFRDSLKRHCKGVLPEHWLTLNISLFSFLGNETMPVYRTHFGIPDRRHPNYSEGDSSREKREVGFASLSKFQKMYSTVWEIVNNNVDSIFYFDKTPQSKKDMIVYEIDPDVLPGKGKVDSKYVGKTFIDGRLRRDDFWADMEKDSVSKLEPWDLYKKERDSNEDEKSYQYSILRFFIRVGIFNPVKAAYAIRPGVPATKDLLKIVFDQWIGNGMPALKNWHFNTSPKTHKEFNDILIEQFKSSNSDKKKVKKENEKWLNFDHKDKYNNTEDTQLDWILELIDRYEPDAINTRISLFEAGFFFLTQDDNTISHIYWMPIIINWKDRWTGGAAFFNSDKRIGLTNEWVSDTHGYYEVGSEKSSSDITPDDEVPQALINTLYFLSGLFADKLIGSIQESIRPSIERAAAVSIMSRNISHNIGSHVLSYQKHIFENEINMLRGGVLHDLVLETENSFRINSEKFNILEDNELYLSATQTQSVEKLLKLPYLRSIGNLLGYFQERQDYISTFASDRYLYFTSVYFNRNILMNFCGVTSEGVRNIALDHIIYSEGYGKEDIVFESFWREGTVEIPLSDEKDYEISLPSGNTGRQGIYTILENFIRNSAKHGQKKKERGGKLQIRITLSNFDKDFYQLELLDNSGKTTDGVISEISEVLGSPLVKPDGTLDERHKGIKEIQIAAAWLRGIQPHQIMDKKLVGGNMIVQATNKQDDLQYTLFLRKPKDGLLLVKNQSEYYNNAGELLKPYQTTLLNWDIEELPVDLSALNKQKKPYHFVVIHENLNLPQEREKEIKERCPVRFLTGVTDEVLQSNSLKEDLYRIWLNQTSVKDTIPFNLVLGSSHTIKGLKIGIEDLRNELGAGNDMVCGFTEEIARNCPILFREHNDLPEKFDDFKRNANLDKFIYVEGISGGNTTGRLLRNEPKDTYWYYKMLETALTKVIIIDERIWRNHLGETQVERERNFMRWDKKNIHIFSLENHIENGNQLVLRDLRNLIIATLDNNGTMSFTNKIYENKYSKSHFISLHQGLMERAVKHCSDSDLLKDLDEKKQVSVLFESFRSKLFKAEFRVMIHSGRSKAHVMPPNTAFVQLSSLSSALEDSKYTLCDLFYATIREIT